MELTDLTLANIVCQNITEVAINTDDFETQFWHFFILSVASLVMVVGTLGNLLTLAAIPYVRRRYPAEFSLLQLPVTDLLNNLSVFDSSGDAAKIGTPIITINMAGERVCLIGSGPSGMAFLYHLEKLRQEGKTVPEVVCYEKAADWGGLWNYDWRTGTVDIA